MNDLRRLNELRAQARASYYCCRREIRLTGDTRLHDTLEHAAFTRWRLARSIDAYLVSGPAGGRSRLAPTLRDRASRLALQARAALAPDRDLHGLHWLADDCARLRHTAEICRGLTRSLEVSDFLGARLEELKQVQRAVSGLIVTVPGSTRRGAEARTLAAT